MKKDFKQNNPALAFISTPPAEPEPESRTAPEDTAKPEAPEGYKLNPLYVEVKSKRVQLLVQPSTLEAIRGIAHSKGISLNEAVNEAMKAYIKKEG